MLKFPKEQTSMMPVIMCSEAQNLITLIIILARIATNATNGHKMIQLFTKCKLPYLDY
jgi:hypothetical protein